MTTKSKHTKQEVWLVQRGEQDQACRQARQACGLLTTRCCWFQHNLPAESELVLLRSAETPPLRSQFTLRVHAKATEDRVQCAWSRERWFHLWKQPCGDLSPRKVSRREDNHFALLTPAGTGTSPLCAWVYCQASNQTHCNVKASALTYPCPKLRCSQLTAVLWASLPMLTCRSAASTDLLPFRS